MRCRERGIELTAAATCCLPSAVGSMDLNAGLCSLNPLLVSRACLAIGNFVICGALLRNSSKSHKGEKKTSDDLGYFCHEQTRAHETAKQKEDEERNRYVY